MFYKTKASNVLLAANRLQIYGYWSKEKIEKALDQFVELNKNKSTEIGLELNELLEVLVMGILISDVPDDAHDLVVILHCKDMYVEDFGTVRVGKGRMKLRIDPAIGPHFSVGDVVIGYGQGFFE